MEPGDLRLSHIEEAARRLQGLVLETPLAAVPGRDGVHLKLENLQQTGSFKFRGATNAVRQLAEADLRRGVATVSAGNHGLAIATAASRRGSHARVYVPPAAVARKVAAMQAAGAEVVTVPVERIREILRQRDAGDGRAFVPPFADARVVAGQGTVGIEIAHGLSAARTVLVPVGGGGLALGVATALRELVPSARVWGVVAEQAPAVADAWRTGRAEPVQPCSIADGLNVPFADLATVHALRTRLAGLLSVTDDQIRAAVRDLALSARVVAEPAGAAAYAAVAAHPELGTPLVAVVSGGNVDPRLLADAVLADS